MVLIIGLFFMLIGWMVSSRLKSKFKKYSQVHLTRDLTGAEVARLMLADNGIHDVKVKVRSARLGREITIHGFGVRVKLRDASGQEFISYFAVFPEEPNYIKFRVTYPSGSRVQGTIDDFVKQVLEARAAEPAHCFSSP